MLQGVTLVLYNIAHELISKVNKLKKRHGRGISRNLFWTHPDTF